MRLFKYLIVAAALVYAAPAAAATLNFAVGQSYAVGDTVSVTVQVTSDAALNAVGATVSYPADKLEAVSISKAASIINFWAQEPAYSQAAGTASLQGIVYDPGWKGQGGRVVQIVFRAKAAGTATLSFGDAQVLANDGQGTNILTSAPAASVIIKAAAGAPVTAQSGVSITSSTHPDQTKWYKAHDVSLSWKNLAGTTAVRLGYDKDPRGVPTVSYDPLTKKSLTLPDGLWYFHVQDQTGAGWSTTATYKIQIDSTPPLALDVRFPHGATSTDPRPVALFNTTDALSGIDHYDIKINGNSLFTVTRTAVESNPYALPLQDPGPGTIQVVAYDAAGNTTTGSATFDITGLGAPKLDPVKDISAGDLLQVTGVAAPDARVDIYLTDAEDTVSSQWTRTAGNGAFKVIWSAQLAPGTYTLEGQVTDADGAKSAKTDPVSFTVKPQALGHLGPIVFIKNNAIGVLLLVILAVAAGLVYRQKLVRGHRRTTGALHSATQAHAVLHKQFTALKDAVAKEVAALEKVKDARKLSLEEERLINKLRALIEKSEAKIEAEVDKALDS